jgi:hypothetical protein
MRKTFIYDPEQKKMVELERAPAPLYTGQHGDPTGVDCAMPRALKEISSQEPYNRMSRREFANACGFKQFSTISRTWNDLL